MKILVKAIQSFFLTAFVFSFAGWAYIALNAVFHPQSLEWPLTHLAPYPREDTFGIACFAVSIVSFFIWNIIKKD